jgi:hypothetical protein
VANPSFFIVCLLFFFFGFEPLLLTVKTTKITA